MNLSDRISPYFLNKLVDTEIDQKSRNMEILRNLYAKAFINFLPNTGISGIVFQS
jgi:hypothetical protein